jgi:hypothetical protein
VSCSFTLVREDVCGALGFEWLPVDVDALNLEARVDLIAAQIDIYGEGQPDVATEVLAWARATVALGRKIRFLVE